MARFEDAMAKFSEPLFVSTNNVPQTEITRRLLVSAHHAPPGTGLAVSELTTISSAAWAPGLSPIFRITLEGELADRPLLADLTSATGARPIILQAEILRRPEGVATTIFFSVYGADPDLAAKISRYLTRAGASVEILGHAQPTP
jgi:hypothetical protein